MREPLLSIVLLVGLTPLAAAVPQGGGGPPLPPPLPPPPVPPVNSITAAKANLGKVLFWDEQLSATRTIACGSCHIPAASGSDPRTAVLGASAVHPGPDGSFGTSDDVAGSPGVPRSRANGKYAWSGSFGLDAQVTPRRSVSILNSAYPPLLFWDGRANGSFEDPLSGAVVIPFGAALESQVLGPPVSDVEMGHIGRDWVEVAARIAQSEPLALSPSLPPALESWIADRSYPQLFAEAFGTSEVSPVRIAMAIATYERTLVSDRAPFDELLAGTPSLSPLEQQGRQIFNQSGCNVCHAGNRLTDDAFHYIGLRPPGEDPGRFAVTGNPGQLGAFRTPSLRNVELRAPYFHTGAFATLEEVVDFYDRGGDFDAPNKPPIVRPLGLTQQQKNALVAFLRRPLTDPRVAAESAPFDRPLLYAESARVPFVFGAGLADERGAVPAIVAVEPPKLGNPSFTVGVHGADSATHAFLLLAGASLPSFLPATSAVLLPAPVELAADGSAFASRSVALPPQPALAGVPIVGGWVLATPATLAATPSFGAILF